MKDRYTTPPPPVVAGTPTTWAEASEPPPGGFVPAPAVPAQPAAQPAPQPAPQPGVTEIRAEPDGCPFPRGSGVAQGSVPPAVEKTMWAAVVDNEPEREDHGSDYPRPKPTDPGGDNSGGWMKVSAYPVERPGGAGFGTDSGLWKQT